MRYLNNPIKSLGKVALVILAFSSLMTTAHAEWLEGWNQGDYEYLNTKSDLQVLIYCPTKEGNSNRVATVSLIRPSTRHSISPFTLTIHDRTYTGPFEAQSRADSSNFRQLIKDLRTGDLVLKYALGTVVYPKSNAAKVIPAIGPNFPCLVGF